MNRTCHILATLLLIGSTSNTVFGQFVWDGSQNDHWNDGSNWEGNIGWPNGQSDRVEFPPMSFTDREFVNLRGNTYSVAAIDDINAQNYTFRNGKLLIYGGIDINDLSAFSTTHVHNFDIDLQQMAAGTWDGAEDSHFNLNGVLSGAGAITITDATYDEKVAQLNAANTYTGTMTIDSGYIVLGHSNALQNATVVINNDNGLRFVDTGSYSVGALRGASSLNIQDSTFSVVGSGNATFAGDITGAPTGLFRHTGTGTQTLTGDITTIDQVLNIDGNLNFSGNSVTLAQLTSGFGNLRIQDGADVDMRGGGEAWSGSLGTLWITGAGSHLRNGAKLLAATGTGEGGIRITDSGLVSDFDIVSAGRLGTGYIQVDQGGTLMASALGLGGEDDLTNGGKGILSVSARGLVDIDGETRLWTDASEIFMFVDASVKTGTLTNPPGTNPNISLSDPTVGAALTIGTDAAVGDTTFSGTIDETGPGSLVKTGTNTAILTGNNTYSGGTTINGGTLLVDGSDGSPTGTGGVTINAGGTFGGIGLASGPCIVNSGGTLAIGTPSAGGFLTTGPLTLNPGSTFEIDLGGTSVGNEADFISIGGDLVLGGTLDVNYINGFTASEGDSFIIAQALSTSGAFDQINAPDGRLWRVTLVGENLTLTVCDDTDNDGVCDSADICDGFDDTLDVDTDGVPDGCDVCPGFDDTLDADTDGVADGCDVCPGFDDNVDANSNGIPDACDAMPVHNITQMIDHISLQSAIDAASNGDVIEADAGIYHEAIDFSGKALTLRSSSGNPNDTIIDGSGHVHVVVCATGEGSGTILEGFTITGGNASGPGNNRYGGGIYCSGSSPTITNCTITGNSAAKFGGGLYSVPGSPTLTNCVFSGNSSGSEGGGLFSNNGSPTVTRCRFIGNTTAGGGGAMYLESWNATVAYCAFEGNAAAYGGGVSSVWVSTITNCTFTGNSASESGGGIAVPEGNQLTVTNCAFSGNSATESGGGMALILLGGATVTNCTFTANTAGGDGGGLSVDSVDNSWIANSIFWNNNDGSGMTASSQVFTSSPPEPIVAFSVVMGGWTGLGGNNIDADPLFVDTNGGDGVPGTVDDDLRLLPGSPCIDAADYDAYVNAGGGATDLSGDPRPLDDDGTSDSGVGALTYLDIGAYEFQGTTMAGDCDNDGDVDLDDYAGMEACFAGPGAGIESGCECYDLDDSNDVDLFDFAKMQTLFTGAR